ncbi:MAG: hypothetical protein ACKKMO_01110 [Candidatus Nealsonbacteria bacterium]
MVILTCQTGSNLVQPPEQACDRFERSSRIKTQFIGFLILLEFSSKKGYFKIRENKTFMHFTDLHWWLIIILNFIGYLIFLFGVKANKEDSLRQPFAEIIEFFGGTTVFISFVLMFWLFGIVNGLMLILIFWFVITPIVRFLIRI